MINLRKLESELWESADLLRAESKLTSQEYCMPVLGLIFLRYAYSRFRYVEAEIMKDRPDGDRKAAHARRADALGAARGEKADQFLSKQWNF